MEGEIDVDELYSLDPRKPAAVPDLSLAVSPVSFPCQQLHSAAAAAAAVNSSEAVPAVSTERCLANRACDALFFQSRHFELTVQASAEFSFSRDAQGFLILQALHQSRSILKLLIRHIRVRGSRRRPETEELSVFSTECAWSKVTGEPNNDSRFEI